MQISSGHATDAEKKGIKHQHARNKYAVLYAKQMESPLTTLSVAMAASAAPHRDREEK